MQQSPNISPWHRRIPMLVTYSRIAVAPVFFLLLPLDTLNSRYIAASIFVVASATDWLDGALARHWKVESAMGKFMDPIADKILVLSALIILLFLQKVDPFMVTLLLSRDIYIGGLRAVAAANNVIIAAKPFGKWKTGLQMTAIPCLFFDSNPWDLPLYAIGYYGLWISVLFSWISGAQYVIGYYRGRH